jgi:glycosyltransferase involved in cell wall biosynthesis
MKILLVHNNPKYPWVKTDFNIFQGLGEAHIVHFQGFKKNNQAFIKVKHADLVVFWFASFSFIPILIFSKLLRKKTLMIAGGFDVSSLPEINYGAFSGNWISRLIRQLMFYFSDEVIGVSQSNANEIEQNVTLRRGPAKHIHLGFDLDGLPEDIKSFGERKKQVVMIANVVDDQTYKLKGFGHFLEVARGLPEIEFIHVGSLFQHPVLPSNVTLKGELDINSSEFLDVLNSSRVVFHHSMIESFCAAIVDGALMGCLPVVSDRFSLPEVVGMDGIVIPYGNTDQLVKAVSEAVSKEIIAPDELRKSYISRFSKQKREDSFRLLLQQMFPK